MLLCLLKLAATSVIVIRHEKLTDIKTINTNQLKEGYNFTTALTNYYYLNIPLTSVFTTDISKLFRMKPSRPNTTDRPTK